MQFGYTLAARDAKPQEEESGSLQMTKFAEHDRTRLLNKVLETADGKGKIREDEKMRQARGTSRNGRG